MSDPREHYCACGRWGSFGKKVPRGATEWFCGLVGGEPACSHGVLSAPAADASTASAPEPTIATPPLQTDLFGTPT